MPKVDPEPSAEAMAAAREIRESTARMYGNAHTVADKTAAQIIDAAYRPVLDTLRAALRGAAKEEDRMRAALEFYADETRWIKDQSTPSGGIDLPSFAEKDKGDIARAALSAEEGSDAS